MSLLKKAAITASLVAACAGNAMAEEETFTACTQDGQTATLVADVTGGIVGGPTLKEIAALAFTTTASLFDAVDLPGNDAAGTFEHILLSIRGDNEITEGSSFTSKGPPTTGAPACTPQ